MANYIKKEKVFFFCNHRKLLFQRRNKYMKDKTQTLINNQEILKPALKMKSFPC